MPRLGAWSARLAASPDLFAPVPDSVSEETAAALPVAGLTALYVLEDAGPLIGRRVLVTGASGGVGHIACQLAAIGGAEVTGLVRGADGEALLETLGIASARPETLAGDFDVVIDSVGGETLARVMGVLATGGLCITIGATAGRDVTIDAFAFYQKQRRLEGFGLFPAIAAGRPPRAGLTRLLALTAAGRLTVDIGHRGDWGEIAAAAALLSDRGFKGKAVLKVSA
jgi:NADPH:quinone reductase-like Zn-dependent oxidoreductase